MLALERVAEGFAVAALAHRDHDGVSAARGLTASSALHAGVRQIAEVGRDSPSRRAFLHGVFEPAVFEPAVSEPAGLPPLRLERAWLRPAALLRPGFTPEPQLIACLAKLRAPATHGTRETRAPRERG